jgi:hypothetical protein
MIRFRYPYLSLHHSLRLPPLQLRLYLPLHELARHEFVAARQ